MERKIIHSITAVSVLFTLLCVVVLYFCPNLHASAMEQQVAMANGESMGESVLGLIRANTEKSQQSPLDQGKTPVSHHLRMQIPDNVNVKQISFKNNYLYYTVQILVPGLGTTYFYDYPMTGSCDHIVDLTYGSANNVGMIEITLDSVYEPTYTYDDKYMYIDFVDPHEVYDYIVVVDAGHGGIDVGASHSGVLEKDLNLEIVQKMKLYFDSCDANIGVYYTRLDDSDMALAQRVNLANRLQADLFLSVHINSTASGRTSSINGTEVMYRVSDESGKSKAFAKNCLNNLLASLGSQSKGVVAGDEILIIRTAKVPVALAEIGFITNTEERHLMESDEYQKRAAEALYRAVMETLEEQKEET
ncbi:MAG: N-acetylmuramoyl-L-alanine amidase [Lachnospiraceae bacterium]|nr:N-acetylmuramoyl-L-alanine amidase [Lachnospiraceae bacterium]